MEGVSLIYTPVLVRRLLGPLSFSGALGLWLVLLGLIDTVHQTVLLEGITCLQLPTHPIAHPMPLPPTHSLYVQSMILQ